MGSGGEASDLLTGIGVMDVAVGGFGEGDEGEGDGDGDQEGNGKGRPKLTAEEKKAIKDEIKEAMVAAAQAAGAGKIPAGVARLN